MFETLIEEEGCILSSVLSRRMVSDGGWFCSKALVVGGHVGISAGSRRSVLQTQVKAGLGEVRRNKRSHHGIKL